MVVACRNAQNRLLVFHDQLHQLGGVEQPSYPPHDEIKEDFLTHVVRLPGASRDSANPHRKDVDRATESGRGDFYPLLDERVKGDEVQYEDVVGMPHRDTIKDDAQYYKHLRTMWKDKKEIKKEHHAHDTRYASTLASCLEKLSEEIGGRWDYVAVVVPGAYPMSGWHKTLSGKAKEFVQSETVRKALKDACSDGCNEKVLFFGPVEQIAGLERPIVLLVGFQHSRRLCSRWRVDGGKIVDPGRVDPAVYQAITRCTYRLVVIEPHARHMMRHHKISECSDNGMVPWSVEGEGTVSYLSKQDGRAFLRTKVRQPLSELSSLPDLGTITELIVDKVSQAEWRSESRTPFRNMLPLLRTLELRSSEAWTQVECQDALLGELATLTQLRKLRLDADDDDPIMTRSFKLTSVEVFTSLTELRTLNLRYNELESVKGLESLTQLKELDLNNNKLGSIWRLKSLTQLQTLNLRQNQLKSVVGLAKLTQLETLNLNSNQLMSVGALKSLKQLQTLYLRYNQLDCVETEGLKEVLTHLRTSDFGSQKNANWHAQKAAIRNWVLVSMKEMAAAAWLGLACARAAIAEALDTYLHGDG